jgi:Druantia protein DruA
VLEVQVIQGREIGPVQIAEIQGLIEANPLWSRWRLSRVLAQRWEWYAVSGQLKDMAARALLLKLQQRGFIELPERRRLAPARGVQFSLPLLDRPAGPPIVSELSALQPLQISVVSPKQPDYALFRHYLAQYHYLSFRGPVGQSLGYLIRSCTGEDLACLLFGAAAWQCAPRDRWIGWSAEQRTRGLPLIANNHRFLILPWVRVPQLANRILGQIGHRIRGDWQTRYHHGLDWLESFVQSDRFFGACYRAANWIHVGQTTGRTRQSGRHRDNQVHAPVKDIYLYPLSRDGRHSLR